ncbi:hypothetical protein ACQ4PT_028175 [Festuca glaucescens]
MRADRVMAEGAKRIDLGAPLRSAVRPPCHKPDLNSGPVRHPGAVPFVWEQSPGRPKSVRTRRPAPSSPAPSSHHPRQSEDEGAGGATPYHDALGERDHAPPYPVPAAASPPNRAAERKVEWAEADAKAPEALLSVADVLRNQDEDAGDDEERFSDAQDTLSRTESFTVNCSVSGLSGVPPDRPGTAGTAAVTEPDARGFMMDRFLPAAQAVAVGSPQYTFRKAGAAATGSSAREHAHASWRTGGDDDRARRTPVQLPYQHLPPNYLSCNYPRREEPVEEDDDDDDDYDVQSTRGFASKGCGLLPGLCVKTSLLLLNPVPAMKNGKARGRGRGRGLPSKGRGQNAPSPLARSSQNKNHGCDSNGRYWEEVYRHKLEQKYVHQGEDKRSKMTSESNHLTFWSDSQTGDGFSPFHHSVGGGGVSPYRRNVALSPSRKESGSFGDEKMSRSNGSSSLGIDHDHGSLVGSDRSSFKGSSSMSSGVDKTSHEDSMDHRAGTSDSIAEDQENDPPTERMTGVREPAVLVPSRNAESVKLDDRKTSTHDTSQNVPLSLEENTAVKKESSPLQYLMPLPVPKSPSDSWLSRNLPSVKNKPPMPSFLGIQVHPKKQAPWASAHPKENGLKPPRQRQIRFADVVERPNYVDTEI